jgi:hypothetical protein
MAEKVLQKNPEKRKFTSQNSIAKLSSREKTEKKKHLNPHTPMVGLREALLTEYVTLT